MLSSSSKKAVQKHNNSVKSERGSATDIDIDINLNKDMDTNDISKGAILREIRIKNLEKKETEKSIANSVLSPHNSVFEALHNPALNKGVDLSNIKTKIIHNNTNNDTNTNDNGLKITIPKVSSTQFHFQFNRHENDDDDDDNNKYPTNAHINSNDSGDDIDDNDIQSNLDFSITSWQNISSYFTYNNTNNPIPSNTETRSNSQNSAQYPFNLISNNNSNIISSGNNSPRIRNNTDTFNSNTPNRANSPNVASILSGVSGQDQDTDDIESDELSKIKSKDKSNIANDALTSDSETEMDHTVDSSTIISSFVMPRVSIHSNLNSTNNNNDHRYKQPSISNISTSDTIKRSRLNIRIVGSQNNTLMNRFKSYKKTLTNIDFYITNCEFTDLLILIVDNDNYMLPKITKTPCIPIVLTADAILNAEKIPKYLRLCDSIKLNNVNDDLIVLINFLSNINDLNTWRMFLSSLPIKNHMNPITDINSSLIEFHSEKLQSDLPFSSIEKSIPSSHNKKPYNGFIVAGVTVGILSLGIIFIWKKFLTTGIIESHNSTIPSSADDFDSHSKLSLDQYIFLKLKSITTTVEYWGDVAVSQTFILLQKAKLILVDLFGI